MVLWVFGAVRLAACAWVGMCVDRLGSEVYNGDFVGEQGMRVCICITLVEI